MNPLMGRSNVGRVCVVALLALLSCLLAAHDARAEGVGQVLTSKSISAATVALIDPESGTSAGGSNHAYPVSSQKWLFMGAKKV